MQKITQRLTLFVLLSVLALTATVVSGGGISVEVASASIGVNSCQGSDACTDER
jgi:hypothetical protein